MCSYVSLSDESPLMWVNKNTSRLIKVFIVFNICVQCLHSAWFLDGRTLTLVIQYTYAHICMIYQMVIRSILTCMHLLNS